MKKITFIGAGNVAWHLAQAFFRAGYEIQQVWSRTMASAGVLAEKVNAQPVNNLESLSPDSGVYILCLNDDALLSVIDKLNFSRGIVLHTSGTLDISILSSVAPEYGVLYPLQTFSQGIAMNISEVPFLIEASSKAVFDQVNKLASSLSGKVYHADSQQRLRLHIAAVFAGNYSNYMFAIASELLAGTDFNLDILHPLIGETTRKALGSDPFGAQTGPARRGDIAVIRKHLGVLASKPEYAEIYRLIARNIFNHYHPGSLKNVEL